MRKLLSFFLIFFIVFGSFAQGTSVYTKAMGSGDVDVLIGSMQESLELNIFGKEGTYSKNQAAAILREFFDDNIAKDFTVRHEGKSGGGSMYVIGLLKTDKKSINTYLLLKNSGQNQRIQEMRFELE